jgi:hypothetical protein
MLRPLRFALFAFFLSTTPGAFAQEQGGAIQGIVKDSSGGVMPGVTIEARSPSVVGVSTTVTDTKGEYRFLALPPGIYELSASLAGFATRKFPDTRIQLGQILKIDITLQVASMAEQVQVTAESPIIDVKQNAATASITKDIIELMPKSGTSRDFTAVVIAAPGADDESKAGGIQIDGSSGSENRFIIDGMDATALRNGVSGKTVYTDFIQEVQVKASGYAAEYGGSTGGVISAITKSGSNTVHGSGGTYFRNNSLQGARRDNWRINPFDNVTGEKTLSPDDKFSLWSPIGDIGGPFMRDKLWFYLGTDYERTASERTATFKNSPLPYVTKTFNFWSSANLYNWNLSSQLNQRMRVKVTGSNTRSRNRGGAPGLQPDGSKFADGTPTNGFTNDSWTALTTNLTATGPFDEAKFNAKYGLVGTNDKNDLYSGTLDWVLTPKFFATISSGYWMTDTSNPPENAGNAIVHSFGASNINMAGVPSSLQGASGYNDQVQSSNRIVKDRYSRAYVNANTTWIGSFKGEHVAKFGVRYEHDGNDADRGQQQPTITLNWNQARSTLDGRAVRGPYGYYQVSKGVVTTGSATSNSWSLWAQDSWTIQNKLTINAGVRTENEKVPSYRPENPGISFKFKDKIAPRLGFVYDVKGDSKWKTYGSYGKYYDITKLEMPRGSFGAEHWILYYWTLDTFDWPSINCQEGPTGCPGTFIEQVDNRHPANEADPNLTAFFGHPQNTIDPNIKPVESNELSFGLDHELDRRTSVGVRYTHRWLTRTIEDTGVTVSGVGEVFFIANPGFNLGAQVLPPPDPPNPPATRKYDALEFRLTKRLSNAWSLNSSYTLSRLWGNYGGLASSDENGRTSPNVNRYFDGLFMSFDASGSRQPIYGLLPTDRPHYFKAQLTYSAPWGTSVGLNSELATGTPLQTQISWKSLPVFVYGRGDLGRTPTWSKFDLYLQHDVRLMKGQRVNLNVNISNLFDQKIVTNISNTPYRDSMNPTGISALPAQDALFFGGFSPAAQAAYMRSQGATMRDNPLFLTPSAFEPRRQIRFGIKYTF